jgi:hypothetical protein
MNKMTSKEFNDTYPEGTDVVYTPALGAKDGFLSTKTRSLSWELADGTPVVLIEGKAGGVALTHLSPTIKRDTNPTQALYDALKARVDQDRRQYDHAMTFPETTTVAYRKELLAKIMADEAILDQAKA